MEIECEDKKLAKLLTEPQKLKGRYNPAVAKAIIKKVSTLGASKSLAVYRNHDIRLELLKGEFTRYSVHLSANWRMIFRPKEPIPRTPDGGVAEKEVKKIVILDVVDYH